MNGGALMSAYFVFNYSIADHEGYRRYLAGSRETLAGHGAEVLVVDRSSEPVEGRPPPVTVIIRFETKQAAMDWYNSSAYQAVVHHRLDSTDGVAVLCDGFVRPAGT